MKTSVAALSELSLRGSAVTPRWGLAATSLNGKVYVFGGYLWFQGVEGFFNDLYELELSSNTIRRIQPDSTINPGVRFGHTLVADPIHNQLVLFGGRTNAESFNDIWIFNITKNQWTQIVNSNSSVKVTDLGASSLTPVSNTLGNATLEDTSTTRRSESKKSKRINATSKVLLSSTTPPPARSWHSASVHRDVVYIYGGWDHGNHVFNDLWQFDLSTFQWSCITPPDAMSKPPSGRSCHQAVCWNDALYIFGGLRDGDAVIGDMWRFSFENKAWSPVESNGTRPVGRTSAAGALVGDSWVLHGGLTDYPRAGMYASSEVLEFHFPTSTWIQRSVMLSDAVTTAARRYGHVAVTQPASTSIILISGADKYGSACQTSALRVDLLPSQAQVSEIQQELLSTGRIAQLNRERIGELIEAVQTSETQLRQLRSDNVTISDRCQALQTQMASLHQQQSALQASFQNVQQALSAVEQFIPMMKGVGAAIASFGGGGWTPPNSSSSLMRLNSSGNNPGGTVQSNSELR